MSELFVGGVWIAAISEGPIDEIIPWTEVAFTGLLSTGAKHIDAAPLGGFAQLPVAPPAPIGVSTQRTPVLTG